jgi:hypothetical protein
MRCAAVLLLVLVVCNSAASPNLSTPRSYLAAAGGAGLIIFAGGTVNFSTVGVTAVDIYDVSADDWRSNPGALSAPRYGLTGVYAQFADQSLFFFAGGLSGSFSDVVDIYNVTTHTWSITAKPLSVARSGLAAAANQQYVIFAGGATLNNTRTGAVDVYHFLFHDWVSSSPIFPPRSDPAGGAAGDYIVFAGGKYVS